MSRIEVDKVVQTVLFFNHSILLQNKANRLLT